MYKLLPRWLYDYIIKNYNIDYIYELRIRINKPIKINYKGNYETISKVNNYSSGPMIASQDLLNYVVTSATRQSIYAYNEGLKHCYIQSSNGIRIGVCGTVVYDNSKILTIKNITSLNIRIAHEILDCSEKIIDFVYNNGYVKNTLVISPPGQGKTTLVRDLTKKLSDEKHVENILVIDERFEIAGECSSMLSIGKNTDVLSGANKSFAFDEALKTMSPSVIVTDEISSEKDIDSIKQAINSGVKVIATAHAKNVSQLKSKAFFETLVSGKYFDRYITLSSKNGVGTIDCVFDENFKVIYVPYLL